MKESSIFLLVIFCMFSFIGGIVYLASWDNNRREIHLNEYKHVENWSKVHPEVRDMVLNATANDDIIDRYEYQEIWNVVSGLKKKQHIRNVINQGEPK